MNSHEQSAERLLGATLELPPERRSVFLDQACRESPELRRMVEELLFRNGFLKGPSSGDNPESAETIRVNGNLATGTKLGRYSIIEALEIGRAHV